MPERVENIKVGDRIPQIEITMSDGTVVNYDSFLGKTTVLVFFSTSCGDCRYEMPEIQKFYDSIPEDNDIQVIAVSRGESEEIVAAYWKEMNFTFPYSAQNDRYIYELFATSGVPRIYIINGDGIVIKSYDDTNKPIAQELFLAVGIKNY